MRGENEFERNRYQGKTPGFMVQLNTFKSGLVKTNILVLCLRKIMTLKDENQKDLWREEKKYTV